MKTKITLDEAFEVSETLVGILKETKPESYQSYEIKSLFFLKKFKTNNLKDIKEHIRKDFHHVPKKVLDVKIAKTIKKLADKGDVVTSKCPDDKRQFLIDITPKGEKLMKEIRKEVDRKWKEATNG